MTRDLASIREQAHRAWLRIAIDGLAGAGKSTLGKNLARALECSYLDTGLMYRAVTLRALHAGIPANDGPALTQLAKEMSFDLDRSDGDRLLVEGKPAGNELRTPEVDAAVSAVSAHPGLRHDIVEKQRQLAKGRCIVMVGRDIGTVVLPDAPVKIWMVASPTVRADRRLGEKLAESAVGSKQVESALQARDRFDTTRAASPSRKPEDAVVIDTDTLQPEQSLEIALGAVERALNSHSPF